MRHITQQPVALAITLGSLALCIAYAFWYQVSMHSSITTTAQIPVMFSTHNNLSLENVPHDITITLSGRRNDLVHYLSYAAAHIIVKHQHETPVEYPITTETLLLPNTIKLINCTPHSITIT